MSGDEVKEELVSINPQQLSREALEGVVEEFILREGTDYGHSDPSLDEKKERVFKQLKSGHIHIVYSTLTENCTLMTRSEFLKASGTPV